jgi:hypothetical protein
MGNDVRYFSGFGRSKTADRIVDITDGFYHEISELICLKCRKRWIAARPEGTLLKDIECPKHHVGFAIETGQKIEEGRDYGNAAERKDADQIGTAPEQCPGFDAEGAERIKAFPEQGQCRHRQILGRDH